MGGEVVIGQIARGSGRVSSSPYTLGLVGRPSLYDWLADPAGDATLHNRVDRTKKALAIAVRNQGGRRLGQIT